MKLFLYSVIHIEKYIIHRGLPYTYIRRANKKSTIILLKTEQKWIFCLAEIYSLLQN